QAPPCQRVSELLLDLRHGQALPRAERPLAQPCIGPDVEPQVRGEDRGGLAGARQIARVDRVDVAQIGGNLARLFATRVVEGRGGMALPAAVAVPVGFAVAYEEGGGHGSE